MNTCYIPSGELMVDQTFDSDRLADGVLYMPFFDVCAELPSFTAGSSVVLSDCDDGDAQRFSITSKGELSPVSALELCLTVAEDTRSGRSDANQIRVLRLETCSDEAAARQLWATRTAS